MVHQLTVPKEQVAAVFQFPDRELIAEMAAGLVLDPEAKAQTSAIEPAFTEGLERGRQLLCQQPCGEKIDRWEIAARDKTIAFLDHAMVVAAGLALDPFMPIGRAESRKRRRIGRRGWPSPWRQQWRRVTFDYWERGCAGLTIRRG